MSHSLHHSRQLSNCVIESRSVVRTHTDRHTHTGTPVVALHPDVAVVLGHAGLRVQEGQSDAPLGAQTGVVAAALLDGVLVELVA